MLIRKLILVSTHLILMIRCFHGFQEYSDEYGGNHFPDTFSANMKNDVFEMPSKVIRAKRYILSSRKWPYHSITWRLLRKHLKADDYVKVRNALYQAFRLWELASSLRFIEKPYAEQGTTDVVISFGRKAHGDSIPFDGRYGVVAHAFYPPNGHLHFDADEFWTLNLDYGINFYQTAVHEIGHLIGLEHSTDERAAMYPANKPYDPEFTLADDDIRGVRSLYPSVKAYKYDERY